ncbi:NUDIX domain-containing protein [Hyalangium sp.]|uniref:NUDIX domain-containing protein n=1 Tax=Hyalangium sp. TaxID=2028555 RepID=UPI002D681787|nr:NUDIX domain-containing protein [Hyalangium sp.]HYH98256.1 NUDIX domain-containing protein [Hyalangium sp.]
MTMAPGLTLAPGHRVRWMEDRVLVESDDDRSRLRAALERHLRVGDGGQTLVLGGQVRARLGDILPVEALTAFEARFLADSDVPMTLPAGPPSFSPRTDLHTHFAAALPGRTLLELAAEEGVTVPRGLLAEAGIDARQDVPATVLEVLARERLARSLDVPLDRQITFHDMERLYARRSPFTKHPRLFVPQLRAISQELAASGVSYAELSLSTAVEPEVLAALHASLEDIEATSGVRLRFLVALSRHDDLEWDLDVLDRLEQCLTSRAVVGVDIMGHETCSTRAFVPVLERAAALGGARPGFVVRVHAGENPAFPENVRVAVRTLLPFPGVEIRIGHGLYGVDDDTLASMARNADRVVVEFNLTSNLALNNIQTTLQVPLRRYVDAGVAVVLGSDGAGLYGTSALEEARAALACGLDEARLARLRLTEDTLLARRQEREHAAPPLRDWLPPPLAPRRHFTPARAAELAALRGALRAAQDQRLRELGATVVDEVPTLADRPVLWLAGAWRHAFAAWSPDAVRHATTVLEEVLRGLAARGGVLLTGGTLHGVEGLSHGLAALAGVEVLGAIVGETLADDLDGRVQKFWRCARSLYEKAAPVVRLVRDTHGLGLFLGGGLIVADEQQAAHNVRARHVLLSGLRGAAVDAARASQHARFVDDAAGVLAVLDDTRPWGRLHYPGPNDAADVILVRRGALGDEELLLIRRHDDSDAAAGRMSLPGGFVQPGESPRDAAVRELFEETGMRVPASALVPVCVVAGGGRDPRDTDERWVRSHVFAIRIDGAASHDTAGSLVLGGSDAAAALFVSVERRPRLAFDHDDLVIQALAVLAAR